MDCAFCTQYGIPFAYTQFFDFSTPRDLFQDYSVGYKWIIRLEVI